MPPIHNEGGGGVAPPPTPSTPPGSATSTPLGASPSLITSTGGLYGRGNILLVPFYNEATKLSYFVTYDSSNFNCELDCVYNFRLEEVAAGREIDVHKVFLKLRDLGAVTFSVTVTATQYNKSNQTETVNTQTVVIKNWGIGDKKLHSYFVDLKVVGECPQLSVFRAANAGPLAIIKAMLCGHSDEGAQL